MVVTSANRVKQAGQFAVMVDTMSDIHRRHFVSQPQGIRAVNIIYLFYLFFYLYSAVLTFLWLKNLVNIYSGNLLF